MAVSSMERMVFPNLPLKYEEMLMLVPERIRNPEHSKHRAVYGLIQHVARHLEDARMVSMIPPGKYLLEYRKGESEAQTQFRIRGIQQEMAAVRFRLGIGDYRGPAEEAVLEKRMQELYKCAKQLDPSGVARFEHRVDRKIRKERIREYGYQRRNEAGRNERVREAAVKHSPARRGEPDRVYRCQ